MLVLLLLMLVAQGTSTWTLVEQIKLNRVLGAEIRGMQKLMLDRQGEHERALAVLVDAAKARLEERSHERPGTQP